MRARRSEAKGSALRRSGRREFLARVGQGMFVAGVGYELARELGLTPALAEDSAAAGRLDFGAHERLAALLEETPPERLLPAVTALLRQGTGLKDLVAAAALANARSFGGDDYVGFHTFMALAPSYHMSMELPAERKALPVLKVLYRNASRLKDYGSGKGLQPVAAAPAGEGGSTSQGLREAIHRRDLAKAEGAFASLARASAEQAWNNLLETVQEAPEVHRIVLAHRAWDMLALTGPEHAETLLRQSLHYCVRSEVSSLRHYPTVRTLLPKILEEHHLLGRAPGSREVDDGWIERMSQTLFAASAEQAAGATAAALAEGIAPDAVAQAISLAANQLVLRDSGRNAREAQANKPVGSVHGDSIGVHACDSANAWRHISRVSSPRNSIASLILSGYQVALDRVGRGGNFLEWQPRPPAEELEKVTTKEPEALLRELDGAIREKNQERACAIVQRCGVLGHPARGVLDLLLKYSISEDGALHAEKYYRTTTDEYAALRPAFRHRQLVALARVVASEYGTPAPGYTEACGLLNL